MTAAPDPDSYRHNYRWNLVSGVCMLASMGIASINLVLPWLLSSVGASHAVAVLIIPFARGGELAGNLLLARPIGQLRRAKWAAFGSLTSWAILVALLAPTLLVSSITLATMIFLVVAVGIGFADGAKTLSSQVVIAKTVRQDRQGDLFSTREMLAGVAAFVVFLLHAGAHDVPGSTTANAVRLAIAAVLALMAAFAIARVDERASEPATGRHPGIKLLPWHLLRDSPVTRRYVLMRTSARPTYLLVPFLVLHVSAMVEHKHALSTFVMASIIGTILGSAVARRFADRDLPAIVLAGPLLGCATILYVLSLDELAPLHELILYAGAFLGASAAAKFLGIGIDTFLVKVFPEQQVAVVGGMAKFIAVGFTMGFAALLGILAQGITTYTALGVMAGLQLFCVWMAWRSLADVPAAVNRG